MNIKKLVQEKPTQTIPVSTLFAYYNEMVNWQKHKSFHIVLNANSIKAFMEKYGAKCEDIVNKLIIINTKHYETDGKGNFILSAEKKPVLKLTSTIQDYDKEIEELMSEQIEFSL